MRAEAGPNIVLVVLDTARADAVGAAYDTAFAQLGRRGRRFDRGVAPAPWTLPSHASIFSGLRPSEHGITGAAVLSETGPRSPRPMLEALADRWLPEALRRRGYATFCASANPWVGNAVGLTYGFEIVFDAWRAAPLPKLADPLSMAGSGGVAARYGHAALVYARRALGIGDGGAAASLNRFRSFARDLKTAKPFFAFFNVMEPHAPYAPPRGFRSGSVLTGVRVVRSWNADRMLHYCLGRDEITEEDLTLLRDLYRGEIAYSDSWLARLFEALGGALDDTLLIVTSDHGENLGEHHLLSHVMSMHETLLRVPLAIAGPGVPVGIESAPTGLTALGGTVLASLDGRWEDPSALNAIAEYESAAAQVSGARRLEDQVKDVTDELRERLRAQWVAVYEERFKYIASSVGEERLVDLDADPFEQRDVAPAHPDIVTRLRAMRPAWSDLAEPSREILDAEITSHLEGLGYL